MLRIGVLRPLNVNKKELGTSPILFYGVEKGTILEPYDKKILANLSKNCNIYCKLVLLIKLDTQAYYNMRMVLGLEIIYIFL